MSKIKIVVDPKLCIGCGSCAILDQITFALDQKTGKAKVISQPKKKTKELESAIISCPTNAIKITNI